MASDIDDADFEPVQHLNAVSRVLSVSDVEVPDYDVNTNALLILTMVSVLKHDPAWSQRMR